MVIAGSALTIPALTMRTVMLATGSFVPFVFVCRADSGSEVTFTVNPVYAVPTVIIRGIHRKLALTDPEILNQQSVARSLHPSRHQPGRDEHLGVLLCLLVGVVS